MIKGVGVWHPELYTVSWIADSSFDSVSCFLALC